MCLYKNSSPIKQPVSVKISQWLVVGAEASQLLQIFI